MLSYLYENATRSPYGGMEVGVRVALPFVSGNSGCAKELNEHMKQP